MNKTELLTLFKSTQEKTLHYYDLDEADLDKTYGPGKWSIRQILHHLCDAEILLNGRLKKIIAEPKQVIWAYDQDLWGQTFAYATTPLAGKKEVYSVFRDMNYALTDSFYESHGQKEFVHNETGLRTLKMEFEKVAIHNESHNKQVAMALSF